MKITGQIAFIMITFIFALIQVFFLEEPTNIQVIHFLMALPLAWFLGRQYDKAKYYGNAAIESERNYKQLIEILPDCIIIYDNEKIIYVNKAGELMIGAKSKQDILGKSIYQFITSTHHELAVKNLKQLYNSPTNHVEQKLTRLDGEVIFVEVSSRPIVYEGKEVILSLVSDITDKKQTTETLLQKSEKLAIVGQMAAGIAHEIRNPLTSIKGFIQLLKSKHLNDKEYYNLLLSELDRINTIVGEFLVLAKPTAVVFEKRDLKNLVTNVVTLVNPQAIMNNTEIYVSFTADFPLVVCEENQLKQVFINILKNSIEAMPNGGHIRIKGKVKENGRVSIYFIDEGTGIPEDRIPTLGEPFYTTKEKGTGLGLMTCYRIIENHGGEIRISSKLNKGTIIEVTLPLEPAPKHGSSHLESIS